MPGLVEIVGSLASKQLLLSREFNPVLLTKPSISVLPYFHQVAASFLAVWNRGRNKNRSLCFARASFLWSVSLTLWSSIECMAAFECLFCILIFVFIYLCSFLWVHGQHLPQAQVRVCGTDTQHSSMLLVKAPYRVNCLPVDVTCLWHYTCATCNSLTSAVVA